MGYSQEETQLSLGSVVDVFAYRRWLTGEGKVTVSGESKNLYLESALGGVC